MIQAQTIGVSIDLPPADVYAYLSDASHFPDWSRFILAIRQDGEHWLATTPDGEVRISFTPINSYGVLDHDVIVDDTTTVHVPMRVVKNGTGSEVLFTVYRKPGMTTNALEEDLAMVSRDLRNLRRVLESSAVTSAGR